MNLETGPWRLTDLANVPKNGLTVFSCFHCGGGSTMGYKLAGFTVLGGVEIDPEMMGIYRQNHAPKHSYLMGVQDFKRIPDADLPPELFNLDILDGSPPCSSFSTAGAREKKWGKRTHFREGQAEQVLDGLFFDFIDVAKKLQPRVVVAENVKGLIVGNAKFYVKQIFHAFADAGYDTQLFLLNSSRMGVPQKRERTFFIARRRDLNLPKIELEFNEPLISVCQAWRGLPPQTARPLTPSTKALWLLARQGESLSRVNGGSRFGDHKLAFTEPSCTITTSGGLYHPLEPRNASEGEILRLQTYPDDYNAAPAGARYVCGMSVPPRMMQRVASQIAIQLFHKKSGLTAECVHG